VRECPHSPRVRLSPLPTFGIPVVVLSSSRAEADIYRSYHLGANSFLAKPRSFQDLVKAMKAVGRYWFEIVELPVRDGLA
jgi:two-component system, response regulator